MTEATVPAETQGTPTEAASQTSVNTLADAYKAAQRETAPPPAESGSPETGQEPPVETVEPAATPPPPDPDHVAWAKRYQGYWDAEKGAWNTDAILKASYELNRQNQLQAQSINRIESLLQKPEVLQAIAGAQAKPKPEEAPREPQTDQEILADFIRKEVERHLGPKLSQLEESTQFASQRQVISELARVRDALNSEFGKAGETPVFQEVLPQIITDFEAVAKSNGTDPNLMIESLVKTGRLETTLRSMAKSLLYDRLQKELDVQKRASVTAKKGLAPVPKGSSQAKPAAREPESIAEAFRMAKEQAQKGA